MASTLHCSKNAFKLDHISLYRLGSATFEHEAFQDLSNFSSFEQPEATFIFLSNLWQFCVINKSCFRFFKTGKVTSFLKSCSKVTKHNL